MPDVFPVDFTSDVGRVRKYIPDLRQHEGEYIFTDEEINSFLDDEIRNPLLPTPSWSVRRAAAWAMIAIANDETLILKKIITEDLQTDGPAVGRQLLASAQELFKRAALDEEQEDTYSEVFIEVPNRFAPAPPPFNPRDYGWVRF